MQAFARVSPEVTTQFIATFPICEQTQLLNSVTHCSVMCHHIHSTAAKTHLYMLIHRQVCMAGRSKEELPETMATGKQAGKGNTAQWDMVILKINTNSKHLGCFLQNYFHESRPLLQHLTHEDLEAPVEGEEGGNSSMSMRSRYYPKYYVSVEMNRRLHYKTTLAHFLEQANSCFKANATEDKKKECYPVAAANVALYSQKVA